MQIDLRIVELLISKLCHDLVSPVGAINNGVELITDVGGSVAGDAMKLIGDSAEQASRRLRLFRLAYGRAGSEPGLTARDVRSVAENYLAGGKVSLVWPESEPAESLLAHRGSLKTLLNAILCAEDTLPYGGVIRLAPGDTARACRIELSGKTAQLSEAAQKALEGAVTTEEVTPRTVQPFITGAFCRHFGLRLTPQGHAVDTMVFTLEIAG